MKRSAAARIGRLAPVVVAGLALTACAGAGTSSAPPSVPASVTPVAAPGPAAAVTAPCSSSAPSPITSYSPLSVLPTPGHLPAKSYESAIAARGYLVVGVSGDTLKLGARNLTRGGALEGFDTDIARIVDAAIFGPDPTDQHVRFKVITTGQRFTEVNQDVVNGAAATGAVDLVARAVTMTCDRWSSTDTSASAAFSAEYLRAEQRLLIHTGAPATLAAMAKAGTSVCASTGSTSLATLKAYPGIRWVSAELSSDCLVLWQEGLVDAITGDDTILAGFAAQDPYARLTSTNIEDEPYGLAIGKKHQDFVQFVNAVLASPAGHAAWTRAYDTWLAPVLGSAAQPTPVYGRR